EGDAGVAARPGLYGAGPGKSGAFYRSRERFRTGLAAAQLASGCGCGFEPSVKRERRNGAGSTIGGAPLTMSAINRPAPGPMPKPWPEKPVAMKKPGKVSTAEMTGIASGITSIMPPQLSATATFLKAGKLS